MHGFILVYSSRRKASFATLRLDNKILRGPSLIANSIQCIFDEHSRAADSTSRRDRNCQEWSQPPAGVRAEPDPGGGGQQSLRSAQRSLCHLGSEPEKVKLLQQFLPGGL